MIKKVLFLFLGFPLFLFGMSDPYKELLANEKLHILSNYFLNEELESIKPELPKKEKLPLEEEEIKPTKYEEYYHYIQRLKTIKEEKIAAQKKIDEKYAGQIAYHNRQIEHLQSQYEKKENIDPVIQRSINKALKVVYGEPKILDIVYDEPTDSFSATLGVQDIYGVDLFDQKRVYFRILKSDLDSFVHNYHKAKVVVFFHYENNLLQYEHISFQYNEKTYRGVFLDESIDPIKLDIKINDDIFRLEKIEEYEG